MDVILTVALHCRTHNIYDGVEMQSSIQVADIHVNPSTEKDEAKLSDTTMPDHVIYDTINTQPQEQNTCINEGPSVIDEEAANAGVPNPVYDDQLRVTENPCSLDASTGDSPTHCTADHAQ